jgi:cytochrome c oxidase cbb3-type subunit 3
VAISEHDPVTGHLLTGHEWNGIKELNTPVPRAVWFFLIATALFAIGYWLLMPAWPTGKTYTKGLLGNDQRRLVSESVSQSALARSAWANRIAGLDINQIRADPGLMKIVREDGNRLFGDNCSACHGVGATGGKGFPDLTDKDWLWGGSHEAIAQTIKAGINSNDPKTRVSQMLAFGRDGMLDNDTILALTDYVMSLSNPGLARGGTAKSVMAGSAAFAANCAACHGADARGNQAVGAPNLTDNAWIYGGDVQSVYTSINDGRQGEMPAWEHRLGPVDRKVLAIYLLDKGKQP